jgi:hypothetical protein
MRTPIFLPLSTAALVVAIGAACSSVVVADGGHTSGGPSPAPTTAPSSTTSPPPSSTTSPPPPGVPGAPPSCPLTIDGAVVLDVPDATPTAGLDGLSEVDVSCAFTRGDVAYTLVLEMDDVHGPASYTAPRARLDRYCLADSCPGDWGFAAYAPAPTCTIDLDTFAPATRGGMTGSFSCPQIPIDDPEDPNDMQAVAVQGTFVFPPPGEGEVADAGPDADAGPPTCTMTVSAPFATGAMPGEGEAISGMAECTATASGVTFSLEAPIDAMVEGGQIIASGASFCSAGCTEVYVPTTPCDVHVIEDQGVGGHFAAQVVCHGMVLDGYGAGTEEIDVIADIDGIHAPTPPPD